MKTIIGKVVSNKMINTVVIEVEHVTRHAIYGKMIRHQTRIKADSTDIAPKLGNVVRITETKPLSKGKHYKVTEIISEK